MAAAFLILLVGAWLLLFLPAASRARERDPLISAESFQRGLQLIGPQQAAVPRPATAELRPRLTIKWGRFSLLVALLSGVVSTAVLAVARGGGALELHLAFDALFVFYAAWLLEYRRRQVVRSRKVASLAAYRARELQDERESLRVAGEPR